jgi:hypothetical protein
MAWQASTSVAMSQDISGQRGTTTRRDRLALRSFVASNAALPLSRRNVAKNFHREGQML